MSKCGGLIVAVASAGLLSACVSQDAALSTIASQRDLTAVETQSVLNKMRTDLRDPYSIRDVSITPMVRSQGRDVACVRFNSRNAFGGYTGLVLYSVHFRNGVAHQFIQQSEVVSVCGGLRWKPFVEAEQLRTL